LKIEEKNEEKNRNKEEMEMEMERSSLAPDGVCVTLGPLARHSVPNPPVA
jgi:hypothetical protein